MSNPTVTALARQLEAASLNQRVIASNIANANTPGYKKYHVVFQDELSRALNGSTFMIAALPGHIGGYKEVADVHPRVVQERGTSMRHSQNNVDLDQEMVNMAANFIVYDFAATAVTSIFKMNSYVIRGGR